MTMVKLHRYAFTSLIAVAALGLGATASAQTAYSDYGPNPGYDINSADSSSVWGGAINTLGGFFGEAMEFQSGAAGYLADVYLTVGDLNGAGMLDIALCTNSGSGTPGSVVESWTALTGGPESGVVAPITLVGNSAPIALSGTYWLTAMVDPSTPALHAGWNENSIGAVGNRDYTSDGVTWQSAGTGNYGAFRVNLTPTPAPEPLTICLGAAGLAIAVRRRANAK